MTTYLIDTSTLSWIMKQNAVVMQRVSFLKTSDQLVSCPVVRGEIEFGIKDLPEGKRRDGLARSSEALFSAMLPRPITMTTAGHYAEIKCAVKRAGRTIWDNDLWIAAIALEIHAILVTADSDFQPLAGLVGLALEDWTKPT